MGFPLASNVQVEYGDSAINSQNPGFGYGDTVTNALWCEDRCIGGAMYRVQNATWSKFAQSWSLVNPALPAYGTVMLTNGTCEFVSSPAGTSPFTTWTVVYSTTNTGVSTISPTQATIPFGADFSGVGVFNVKHYNAKGDGVTDDAAAIQAAITAANGLGMVYFPAGTYMVGTSLTLPGNGSTLIGTGPTSILKAKTVGTAIINDTSQRQRTKLANLVFDGNGGASALVTINGGLNHETVVQDCIFQNVSGNVTGLMIGGQNAPTGGNKTCSLESFGVRVSRCLFDSLATGTRENCLIIACQDSLVEGCIFRNGSCNGTGILGLWAYCYNTAVRNCVFSQNTYTGSGGTGFDLYMVESTHTTVQGCTFDTSATTSYAAVVVENSFGLIITNNKFIGYVGGYAIQTQDYINDPDGLVVIWTGSGGGQISNNSFDKCLGAMHIPAAADGTTFALTQGAFEVLGNHISNATAIGMTFGGNAVNGQSIGPLNISNNTVEAGSYTSFGIFIGPGVTAQLQNNIVGDSTGGSSAGFQLDASHSPAPVVRAYNNVSLNHVSAYTFSGGASSFTDAVHNKGYNPVGKLATPAVPATTVAYTNAFGVDATVWVAGGTVSSISIGGQATGATSGPFRIPNGQTITLAYSAAPAWLWFGD